MIKKDIKIMIIGGAGYIGSRLCKDLSSDYDVYSWDLCKFSEPVVKNYRSDYASITCSDLHDFYGIILLAGHSSVRMCAGDPYGVMKNNVFNFANLLNCISPHQTFIYASSASVYGNCILGDATEETPLSHACNMYDMTKQAIDSYVKTSGLLNRRVYGLRLGTVNGFSPIFRDDVMLNAMTSSAWHSNCVNLHSPNTRRSILAISDLTRATRAILNSNRERGGIYNMSSFTSTSQDMAYAVSDVFGVKINVLPSDDVLASVNSEKIVSSKYDFSLDCKKFCDDFEFSFEGSASSIIEELSNNRHAMIHTSRNNPFDYYLDKK